MKMDQRVGQAISVMDGEQFGLDGVGLSVFQGYISRIFHLYI